MVTKRVKVGRPSLYTPKLGGRIIERLRSGVSFEAAAGSCGVSRSRLWAWIKYGQTMIRRAEDKGDALGPVIDLDFSAPKLGPEGAPVSPLDGYEPPDLPSFSEAVHWARAEARAIHEANFAHHARTDWRASWAWLRSRANAAWGDNPERDDVAPKRRKKTGPTSSLGTDLTDELTAARVRLAALREIVASGGTHALPLDRAIALEAATMITIGRIAKAQHEINPGAGKTGDFSVMIELTEAAAAVDMGERVPSLEAGGKKTERKHLEPEQKPKKPPVGGGATGWEDL